MMQELATRMTAFVVCLAAVATVTHAGVLRGSGDEFNDGTQGLLSSDLHLAMMDELLASGKSANGASISAIEDTLRPTFVSMPKNAQGRLDHASAAYILHRYFVQSHGMYMKGLDPKGKSWNDTSPTLILVDRVSDYLQGQFEAHLGAKGLGIHELAMLAATMEHVVQDQFQEWLRNSYKIQGIPKGDATRYELFEILDTFLLIFIHPRFASAFQNKSGSEFLKRGEKLLSKYYPGWASSKQFAHDVAEEVILDSGHNDDAHLSFGTMSQVVKEIGQRFGRWQAKDCQDLKSLLLESEVPGSGRVLLQDFYTSDSERFRFQESPAYLRELGALDESDPNSTYVMIANYVNSPTNCLTTSGVYSLCCIDECESLLGQLEKVIKAPDAEPETIIEEVSRISTSTVGAPRVLSEDMRNRLYEIADHHDGGVPLHGRLFAQWLHFAFPNECAYPHVSGETNPMLMSDWNKAKGKTSSLTKSEIHTFINDFETFKANDTLQAKAMTAHQEMKKAVAAQAAGYQDGKSSMWSREEELVVNTIRPKRRFKLLSKAIYMAIAFSLIEMLRRYGFSGRRSVGCDGLPFIIKDHRC